MNYSEFGGNADGMYFTKFLEKEVADKKRQEEEPKEGMAKSHDREDKESYE